MSNIKRPPEEKLEDLPANRVKHADRLVLPRHLETKLGTHKGLVFPWLRLSQKRKKSHAEKEFEDEKERWLKQKQSKSKNSATCRAN